MQKAVNSAEIGERVEDFFPLPKCSVCGDPHARFGQRYCLKCHAAYMRKNRPKYSELTPEQRRKSNVRSMATVYQKRGKLIAKPCMHCGTKKNVQKHHPDYNRPLDVQWLCRDCHQEHHNMIRVLHVEPSLFDTPTPNR